MFNESVRLKMQQNQPQNQVSFVIVRPGKQMVKPAKDLSKIKNVSPMNNNVNDGLSRAKKIYSKLLKKYQRFKNKHDKDAVRLRKIHDTLCTMEKDLRRLQKNYDIEAGLVKNTTKK